MCVARCVDLCVWWRKAKGDSKEITFANPCLLYSPSLRTRTMAAQPRRTAGARDRALRAFWDAVESSTTFLVQGVPPYLGGPPLRALGGPARSRFSSCAPARAAALSFSASPTRARLHAHHSAPPPPKPCAAGHQRRHHRRSHRRRTHHCPPSAAPLAWGGSHVCALPTVLSPKRALSSTRQSPCETPGPQVPTPPAPPVLPVPTRALATLPTPPRALTDAV